MKPLTSIIRAGLASGLLAAGSMFINPVLAQDNQAEAEKAELRARREAMLADIETVRQDAANAAEAARMAAERLRHETEQMRAAADQMREKSGEEREAQRRDVERMREELSRTHRELRRASQEVARAHRDLARTDDHRQRALAVNLGDRAMLGVILGKETDEGITIVGISPDGPAERVGIESGDILVSLRGEELGGEDDSSPRARVYQIMNEVSDDEEIPATVLRDGKRQDYTIKAEKREPLSWASYIRLPTPPRAPHAPGAPNAPDAPDAPRPATAPPNVRVERIVVPPVDVAELAAEAEALAEELDAFKIRFEGAPGDSMVYEYNYQFDPGEFNFESDAQAFSELSEMALNEAQIWFGNPAAQGIRFTELNDGLKGYFDADRGVLVLDAPEGNPLELQAGDVVLKVGDDDVNATADIVRALRDIEAGDAFTIAIKRHKKNESLEVVMPDNRLGMVHERLIERQGYAPLVVRPADD